MTLCRARLMPALLESPVRRCPSLSYPNAFNEEIERYLRQAWISPSSTVHMRPALDRSSVAPFNRLLQAEVLRGRIASQTPLL